MNNPRAIANAPQVAVTDAVRTATYYQEILGFQLIRFFPEQSATAYVMLQRDNLEIHFGGTGNDVLHYNRTLRPGMPDFIFWIPEIDAYYHEVKAKGAKIAQEIIQRAYGREFIIEDCDGHWLHICD